MKPVKGKDNQVGITLRVEKDVYKALQHHSVDKEEPLTDIVREGIMLYMEKYGIVCEKKSIKAVK